MKIFDELKEDHKTQRSLANMVLRTEGKTDERKSLFRQFKKALQEHANAEERHFYVPMMAHDQSQEKARHSVAEHHEIDELIEKLEKTEMTSSAWLIYFKQLRDLVFHHLDEEENEVFQVAGKVLTEKQKTELGTRYRNMMNEEQNN